MSVGFAGKQLDNAHDGDVVIGGNLDVEGDSLLSEIRGAQTDGTLYITSGRTITDGSNMVLRGPSHANANDWLLRGDAGNAKVKWEDAVDELQLKYGRLNFPDAVNVSTDGNTLDDYEEGSFIPTLEDNSTQGVGNEPGTYQIQAGQYIKIGGLVNFSVLMKIGTLSPLVGTSTYIHGLPFVPVSSKGASVGVGYGASLAITAGQTVAGYMTGAQAVLLRLWDANAGTSNMTAAEWSTNGYVMLSGTYHTLE